MPMSEAKKRSRREYILRGDNATAQLRYAAKETPARQRATKNWNHSARHRAHSLMRKYGMTLGQAEKLGVVPPDVQEALHGDHPA